MPELLLDGVRVIDLSRILAGPLCAMMLGDLGADVIKVERPSQGDDTRSWGPPFLPSGQSAYFVSVNRNKRSIALDLQHPDGQQLLARLLVGADVVVENFRPGTLSSWGFSDAWFSANAPRAVRCTISGYGPTGPSSGRPGYDFILQAETGLMAITGEPDGEPMKLGVAIVDLSTGMMAAFACVAALHGRNVTGRGKHVEVNLHDTGLQLLANVAGNYLASGEEARRYGNGHPNIVPYRTYAASDGWLAVAVGNDTQFQRFAQALGHEEWARHPRYRTNPDRVSNREELDRIVNSVIAGRDLQSWLGRLTEADIPATAINTVGEALSSEHAAARHMIQDVTSPGSGPLRLLRLPLDVDGSPTVIRRPPPRLGQHGREILSDLGIDDPELERLRASGVLG